jgi:hypothetical protein
MTDLAAARVAGLGSSFFARLADMACYPSRGKLAVALRASGQAFKSLVHCGSTL